MKRSCWVHKLLDRGSANRQGNILQLEGRSESQTRSAPVQKLLPVYQVPCRLEKCCFPRTGCGVFYNNTNWDLRSSFCDCIQMFIHCFSIHPFLINGWSTQPTKTMWPVLCPEACKNCNPCNELQGHEPFSPLPVDPNQPRHIRSHHAKHHSMGVRSWVGHTEHGVWLHAQLFLGNRSWLCCFLYQSHDWARSVWPLRCCKSIRQHVCFDHLWDPSYFQTTQARCLNLLFLLCFIFSTRSIAYQKKSFVKVSHQVLKQTLERRLSYSGPGIIKRHCFPKVNKPAELGSTFKACHVKSLLWWLAMRTRQASEHARDEPPQIFQRWYKCVKGFYRSHPRFKKKYGCRSTQRPPIWHILLGCQLRTLYSGPLHSALGLWTAWSKSVTVEAYFLLKGLPMSAVKHCTTIWGHISF